MKHFKNINIADLLIAIVPVALVIPNLMLWGVGHDNISVSEGLASVLLPLGVYLLIICYNRNIPRTTLFLFPLMVICAFQIVVSMLYSDSSPIGVDMFLNVVTTNSTEVNELLSSLVTPVIFVFVIYVPLIVLATIQWCRHSLASDRILPITKRIGYTVTVAGIIIIGVCAYTIHNYDFKSKIFPINPLINMGEAINRYQKVLNYDNMSSKFSYQAQSSRPRERELYIAVIGETARADNWQILGYNRPTNPGLKSLGNAIIGFKGVFSESNTTHKAVPMLLTTLSADNFEKGIYRHKSIITAFKEAGFSTVFISNQEKNKSFIDKYAREADCPVYLPHNVSVPYDQAVIPVVDSLLTTVNYNKMLIVLHLYGSHYKYQDRYPESIAVFKPDDNSIASYSNSIVLRNAYDNTIVNTDDVLTKLIKRVSELDYNSALLYCSDHGEDIYDDVRDRFLHASPIPSYWQLHVPMCFYANGVYRQNFPMLIDNAQLSRNSIISSSQSFAHSLLQLSGIETKYLDYTKSIFDEKFTSPASLSYLNDMNEVVCLKQAGFESYDFEQLYKLKESLYEK